MDQESTSNTVRFIASESVVYLSSTQILPNQLSRATQGLSGFVGSLFKLFGWYLMKVELYLS